MRRQGSRWRLGLWLLWGNLLGSSGCLAFLHPITAPTSDLVESCHTLPRGCRNHVYVFLINGLNPADSLAFSDLREYVNRLGFGKTYSGQVYHAYSFAHEIRRIHREDPEAHVVVVGSPTGVKALQSLLPDAQTGSSAVDAVVYIGERPAAEGASPAGAAVWVALGEAGALALVAEELTEVAGRVTVVETSRPETGPALEEAPTPRPVVPQAAGERDEWDFLKPVAILHAHQDEPERTPPVAPQGEKLTAREEPAE